MPDAVPPSLLFEYTFAVPRLPKPPARGMSKPVLPDSVTPLRFPSQMCGAKQFGDVRIAWHPAGLAIRVTVKARKMPVSGASGNAAKQQFTGDVVHVWLNTRPGTDVRRATRHCHYVSMLPVDMDHEDTARIVVREIAQQRDNAPIANTSSHRVWSLVTKHGYDLSAWLPATELTGFREVPELRRLGFYCVIDDAEFGTQPLVVSDGFPYASDPSLWPTLELVD